MRLGRPQNWSLPRIEHRTDQPVARCCTDLAMSVALKICSINIADEGKTHQE